MTVEVAPWAPRPVIVVIDPAAIVIPRPSPRFITYPGPSVWWTPGPTAVTIGRPIVVVVDDYDIWPPDPAVFVCVGPTTIGIQIFCAPDVIIIVLGVVT